MIFILFLSAACWGLTFLTDQNSRSSHVTSIAPTISTILPSPSSTVIPPSPTSTVTPTSIPIVIPSITASFTPLPTTETFKVLFHPDDALYVGDKVSIEVVPPHGFEVRDASLHVQVDPPDGLSLDPVQFGAWGIQGREQATLLWAWDTQNLDPGVHTLGFSISPQEYSWTEQVTLLPADQMPPGESDAKWTSTQTQCCSVFYITNTASERDLSTLTNLIDEQALLTEGELGTEFTQPITVTLLPRLLGHGGFTSDEISVSYLDRNYAANSWAMVVHHEMLHKLDGQLGGDLRPSLFVEGLAVYLAGGHFKQEPLMPRAAALLENYLDWYIPLETLADDFYSSQHEIGYLEAAALIEFLVKTYGWDAFSDFYRDIHNIQGGTQSDAIDAALEAHFSISLSRLEQDFLAALRQETDTATWVDDVRLTVFYFDTLRRYQQLLDPSAFFRTAWLMDNADMRQQGIVADYLRHPHGPQNLALETLFITASEQIAAQQYSDASQILDTIDLILNGIEQGASDPFSVSPLAADYFSISSTLQTQGYEVQRMDINENAASVFVTSPTGPELQELQLSKADDHWSLAP